FSLAALEVLASGVPMIMSNIGGASEIVEDGVNGYLFEAGNTEQLVERLRTIAAAETRQRMRRAARPSVERYNVDRMIAAYESLALELAAEGSGLAAGQTERARAG
ncbi:MAG TPA: glycosyltransferase, partial [Microvirga sp.]